MINGKKFNPAKIVSGVSQRTVLGPVLNMIFINDPEKRTKHFNISFLADDTRVLNKLIAWSSKMT